MGGGGVATSFGLFLQHQIIVCLNHNALEPASIFSRCQSTLAILTRTCHVDWFAVGKSRPQSLPVDAGNSAI